MNVYYNVTKYHFPTYILFCITASMYIFVKFKALVIIFDQLDKSDSFPCVAIILNPVLATVVMSSVLGGP